jgi:hypothetical protein
MRFALIIPSICASVRRRGDRYEAKVAPDIAARARAPIGRMGAIG